ncbi:MAG: amino acid dehydrogenase [Lysobacterales bacterium 69-70]|nr:FAD-dependent oxidoreductase [Xanthomonadaceae bacterium]ODU31993.1 MAG: amino acid dehydrogenase [Xanthomonadaceae bacterium SCN 69-320]ODV20048.1 MAG: amino acid dehydrogenase [Xanthomonadaceae bacterium SCN 69-25]OJZ01716.1 MAG: amino acid dehydrogenase [Xanthomonadales bacterium 69-70]
MSESKTDVLILGAGVIGLSCAWYLLQRGRRVTVLDRGRVGGGASHGNCGTLTPSHAAPLAMPGMVGQALRMMWRKDAPFHVAPRLDPELLGWLLRFARRCNWRDFEAVNRAKAQILTHSRALIGDLVATQGLNCGFAANGTLYVFREQQSLDEFGWHLDSLRAVGIPVEPCSAAQVRALEPCLRDTIVGGVFHPGDAQLRPDRYVAELARVVRAAGADIIEDCAAEDFTTAGARIDAVRTSRGIHRADEVVLALGAWSPTLARRLDLRIPLQPGKGYSITYERPALAPRIPLVLKEDSVCVTAWADGYRLGSTMEFAGYDTSLNRLRLDALRRGAARYLREPEGPRVLEEWYGWRPMTWDDLPILGRSGRWDNLTLATGHGMLGVSMSLASGQLVAETLSGVATTLDAASYSPQRFHL